MCLALLINSGNTALNIIKMWFHLTCLADPGVCIYSVSFYYSAKITTFVRSNAQPSHPLFKTASSKCGCILLFRPNMKERKSETLWHSVIVLKGEKKERSLGVLLQFPKNTMNSQNKNCPQCKHRLEQVGKCTPFE